MSAIERVLRGSISRSRALEMGRYLLTGGFSVALNLALLLLLTRHFGLHYLPAITICFMIVTLVSFAMNRLWTFRKRGADAQMDFLRFVTVALAQLPLSLGAFVFCVEVLHLTPALTTVVVGVAFAPALYLLHRGWSFGLKWMQQHT